MLFLVTIKAGKHLSFFEWKQRWLLGIICSHVTSTQPQKKVLPRGWGEGSKVQRTKAKVLTLNLPAA